MSLCNPFKACLLLLLFSLALSACAQHIPEPEVDSQVVTGGVYSAGQRGPTTDLHLSLEAAASDGGLRAYDGLVHRMIFAPHGGKRWYHERLVPHSKDGTLSGLLILANNKESFRVQIPLRYGLGALNPELESEINRVIDTLDSLDNVGAPEAEDHPFHQYLDTLTIRYEDAALRFKGVIKDVPISLLEGEMVHAKLIVYPEGWYDADRGVIRVPVQKIRLSERIRPIKIPYETDWCTLVHERRPFHLSDEQRRFENGLIGGERITLWHSILGVLNPMGSIMEFEYGSITSKYYIESNEWSLSGSFDVTFLNGIDKDFVHTLNNYMSAKYTPDESFVPGTDFYRHEISVEDPQYTPKPQYNYTWVAQYLVKGQNIKPFTRVLRSDKCISGGPEPIPAETGSPNDNILWEVGYSSQDKAHEDGRFKNKKFRLRHAVDSYLWSPKVPGYPFSERAVPGTIGETPRVDNSPFVFLRDGAERFNSGYSSYTLNYLRNNRALPRSIGEMQMEGKDTDLAEVLGWPFEIGRWTLSIRRTTYRVMDYGLPVKNQFKWLMPLPEDDNRISELFRVGSADQPEFYVEEYLDQDRFIDRKGSMKGRKYTSVWRKKNGVVEGIRFAEPKILYRYTHLQDNPTTGNSRTLVQMYTLRYYPQINKPSDLDHFKGLLPTPYECQIPWDNSLLEGDKPQWGNNFWLFDMKEDEHGDTYYHYMKLDFREGRFERVPVKLDEAGLAQRAMYYPFYRYKDIVIGIAPK